MNQSIRDDFKLDLCKDPDHLSPVLVRFILNRYGGSVDRLKDAGEITQLLDKMSTAKHVVSRGCLEQLFTIMEESVKSPWEFYRALGLLKEALEKELE